MSSLGEDFSRNVFIPFQDCRNTERWKCRNGKTDLR